MQSRISLVSVLLLATCSSAYSLDLPFVRESVMKKNVPAPVAAQKVTPPAAQPAISPVQDEQIKSTVSAKAPAQPIKSASSTPKARPVINPANYPKRKDERSPAAQSTLNMVPGVNQIVPIAQNHPNRIVTPFANQLLNRLRWKLAALRSVERSVSPIT